MADNFQVKISGIPELQRRMRELSNKVATRYLKQAVKAGAQKIADAAKEGAYLVDDPNTAENIAANIAVQFASRSTRATGNVMYRIGVLGGARAPEKGGKGGEGLPGGETFHWRFVELGIPSRGIPARPFLTNAAFQAGEYAAEEVATVLEQGLDKAVKEL